MSESHAQMLLWLGPLAVVVIAELVYLRGWLSLRSAYPDLIGNWRLAAFTAGLASVWIAVASPLAILDHQSLTIHMMKHLLLMTVAAPLVLLGAPVFPLVCGLPEVFIKSHPPLGFLPARRLKPSLLHPVLGWLAGTAAVIGWHLPAAFQWGMRSDWGHHLEDVCFLVAGLLFWGPIVQSSSARRSPRWSMAFYLFLATLPCDILSAFLVFCGRSVYPNYLSTTLLFGLSPLQDQECAGAMMWVWVTFAYLIPAVVITVHILSPSNMYTRRPVQNARHRAAGQSLNGMEVL